MTGSPTTFALRPDWLAAHTEPAFDATQPVLDSHHHLYQRPGLRYLVEDCAADLASGHDIRATVTVQARAMLRADGPPEMASLGETEFLNGQAAMSASGAYGAARIAAGIVGHVDLRLGDRLAPVLDRHIAAAGGRLVGIRQPLAWDADSSLLNPAYPTFETLPDDPAFRAGLTVLAAKGLSFDVWAFYPQLPRLTQMARAVPDLRIVVDHLGGVIRAGAHAGRDIFPDWRRGLTQLAACPNVMIKLSGLGIRLSAFGMDAGDVPPTSGQLANLWQPWVMTALDLFGADRCMWGSNFPVDKGSYAYGIGLNTLQRLTATASADARDAIFWRSAAHHYGLADALFSRHD